jgi:putative transposase
LAGPQSMSWTSPAIVPCVNAEIVFHYFPCWQTDGTWDRVHDRLRVRQRYGKTPNPTAAILDSQSAKTTGQRGPKGYDAGKKIAGCKRHVVVDTLGLIWALVTTPPSVQDATGGKAALLQFRRQVKFPRVIWVDPVYRAAVSWTLVLWWWTVEVVGATKNHRGFVVQPKRWIPEHTFGWLNRSPRLSKDYERAIESSKAFVQVAIIHLMVRRIKR